MRVVNTASNWYTECSVYSATLSIHITLNIPATLNSQTIPTQSNLSARARDRRSLYGNNNNYYYYIYYQQFMLCICVQIFICSTSLCWHYSLLYTLIGFYAISDLDSMLCSCREQLQLGDHVFFILNLMWWMAHVAGFYKNRTESSIFVIRNSVMWCFSIIHFIHASFAFDFRANYETCDGG